MQATFYQSPSSLRSWPLVTPPVGPSALNFQHCSATFSDVQRRSATFSDVQRGLVQRLAWVDSALWCLASSPVRALGKPGLIHPSAWFSSPQAPTVSVLRPCFLVELVTPLAPVVALVVVPAVLVVWFCDRIWGTVSGRCSGSSEARGTRTERTWFDFSFLFGEPIIQDSSLVCLLIYFISNLFRPPFWDNHILFVISGVVISMIYFKLC